MCAQIASTNPELAHLVSQLSNPKRTAKTISILSPIAITCEGTTEKTVGYPDYMNLTDCSENIFYVGGYPISMTQR